MSSTHKEVIEILKKVPTGFEVEFTVVAASGFERFQNAGSVSAD